MSILLNEHLHGLSGLSPIGIWKKFISDDIVQHIMVQTNFYAERDCNDKSFHAPTKDILNFLGLLLLSGYHCLPEAKHYHPYQLNIYQRKEPATEIALLSKKVVMRMVYVIAVTGTVRLNRFGGAFEFLTSNAHEAQERFMGLLP
ncbi:hypothetical protein T4D_12824 [Trichinella pseudospiralis]|uniref:PiggyBac transposable element-derived protein domain-containing protein n=1 Tax=Trichinella pseudospiralis TaxID=6337 RepID=A0A0V1FPM6_TRIPS|nr:hypothetical protein T4D_12824 [Trichinella pseudospiralis]